MYLTLSLEYEKGHIAAFACKTGMYTLTLRRQLSKKKLKIINNQDEKNHTLTWSAFNSKRPGVAFYAGMAFGLRAMYIPLGDEPN